MVMVRRLVSKKCIKLCNKFLILILFHITGTSFHFYINMLDFKNGIFSRNTQKKILSLQMIITIR